MYLRFSVSAQVTGFSRLAFAVLLWLVGAYAAQSQTPPTSVTDDLLAAITLQGIRCDELQSLEENGPNDYEVECNGGGQFRLTEIGNQLIITSLLKDVAQAGVTGLETLLRLPGEILGTTPTPLSTSVEVARGLFAIIRLSGQDCDKILEVTEASETDHAVTCSNGNKHRVYTAEDGLVQVEAL